MKKLQKLMENQLFLILLISVGYSIILCGNGRKQKMKKLKLKVFFLCLLVCACCSLCMMTAKANEADELNQYVADESSTEVVMEVIDVATENDAKVIAEETTENVVEDVVDKVSTDETVEGSKEIGISYSTHVQSYGWMDYVSDGATSGTEGKGKRVESLKIKLDNSPYSGSVTYRTHVQAHGWMNWVSDSAVSGTEGQAKRVEAVQIKLTGEIANYYDVYYRVHAQSFGWLGWAKNGESAGSCGASKRVEAIQICLVEKGGVAPGITDNEFVNRASLVKYRTHVQVLGWRDYSRDGNANGSWGINKRLEGINISLNTKEYSGDIQYRTHVQSYGWMNWVSGGALSGTTGQSKRLEAIEIKLTGEIAEHYDIYYRVHCQKYGWMNWVSNGAKAGTTGESKRLEAIQIIMCQKGTTPKFPAAPTNKMIDPTKPMIAITYDDGPGIYTDRVLDVLEKYDAKATFFVIGCQVNSFPNQVRRAYNMGCQIGNHTWSHPMLAGQSVGSIQNQIQSTDAVVKSIIGVNPTVMRPPGGSMNQTVCNTVGKPLIMWSVDPRDWANRSASYVTNHVLNYVQDGDIVLLHDIHYSTAVATETLIPSLINRGYQLVTIDELAQYKGYKMTAGTVYNNLR